MSKRYSVDAEVFQTFLANAFAVQESGLDRRSLSALIEIQRFIASREFDLDETMRMIVEGATRVAQASGTAIGLLETNRNELVYKTGNGIAVRDIGRRVPAVLCVSSPQEPRREILRVENAETDKRIEAEICRQFGATSLLMLPIYENHALLGVLQVLFEKAHRFEDRELRAYRLMVGALEEGILRSLRRVQKPQQGTIVEAIPEAFHPPQDPRSVKSTVGPSATVAGVALQNTTHNSSASSPESFVETGATSSRKYPAIIAQPMGVFRRSLKRLVGRVAARPLSANFPDAAATIGAVIVLSVSLWIFHRSASRQASIDLHASGAHDAQPQTPVKPVFDAESSKLLSTSKEVSAPKAGFKRVRIGPNEVDYVTEDVTIRTFETRRTKPQLRSGMKEVDFGDDVTVRYFGGLPAASPTSSTSEIKPNAN
ncbi:MAG TPA: GAF domain-containing protein [Candidatus Sulfotelmatobacter sp.]|nr:GAF domain-containing protein [Candidatus Sulfotelmatobacter sp.]